MTLFIVEGTVSPGANQGSDFLRIVAPSGRTMTLREFRLSQGSSVSPEMATLTFTRDTTVGSGGSAATPVDLQDEGGSYGGTVREGDTVQATLGTQLFQEDFSVLVGYRYLPPPENRIKTEGGGNLTISMADADAPDAAVAWSYYAIFEV